MFSKIAKLRQLRRSSGTLWSADFERTFRVQTLGGFWGEYVLRGRMVIDDRNRPYATRVLNRTSRDKCIEVYHKRQFNADIKDRFFFAWGWTTAATSWRPEPKLWLFEVKGLGRENAELGPERDMAKLSTLLEPCHLGEFSSKYLGCTIEPHDLYCGLWDQTLIQENYEMLSRKKLELAGVDHRYILANESSAVAALKRLHDDEGHEVVRDDDEDQSVLELRNELRKQRKERMDLMGQLNHEVTQLRASAAYAQLDPDQQRKIVEQVTADYEAAARAVLGEEQ